MNRNEKKEAFKEIALDRRSIRRYDETVSISREEMAEILEMATKAPSSSNMQPWRFVVVNRAQAKEMLLPYAQFNVNAVGTAAAVIAIYGDLESVQNADEIMQKTDALRDRPMENFFSATGGADAPARPPMPAGGPREMVKKMYASLTREQKESIALIDCGLVTMQLMQAARVFGYDTCALGAYDKEAVSKALGMEDERYVPVMLLSIGKAVNQGNPQYRLPVSDVAKFLD